MRSTGIDGGDDIMAGKGAPEMTLLISELN